MVWRRLAFNCLLLWLSTASDAACPRNCSCPKLEVSCTNLSLQAIPTAMWDKQTTSLDLSNNSMTQLSADVFLNQGLVRLQSLSLSGNRLASVNQGIFTGLHQLKKLFLNDNCISYVHYHAFLRLGNVKHIDLRNNNITSLDRQIFVSNFHLEVLELGGNHLTTLNDDFFLNTSTLTSLGIQSCQIQYISGNTFQHTPNLTILNISHNNLERLDANTFKTLLVLQNLDLSHNSLTSLDLKYFPIKAIVNASNNELQIIKTEDQDGCVDNLEELHLSGNPISSSKAFWGGWRQRICLCAERKTNVYGLECLKTTLPPPTTSTVLNRTNATRTTYRSKATVTTRTTPMPSSGTQQPGAPVNMTTVVNLLAACDNPSNTSILTIFLSILIAVLLIIIVGYFTMKIRKWCADRCEYYEYSSSWIRVPVKERQPKSNKCQGHTQPYFNEDGSETRDGRQARHPLEDSNTLQSNRRSVPLRASVCVPCNHYEYEAHGGTSERIVRHCQHCHILGTLQQQLQPSFMTCSHGPRVPPNTLQTNAETHFKPIVDGAAREVEYQYKCNSEYCSLDDEPDHRPQMSQHSDCMYGEVPQVEVTCCADRTVGPLPPYVTHSQAECARSALPRTISSIERRQYEDSR